MHSYESRRGRTLRGILAAFIGASAIATVTVGTATAAPTTAAQQQCKSGFVNTPYTHAGGRIWACNFKPYRVMINCHDGFTGDNYLVYGKRVSSGYSTAYCNSQRATATAVLIGYPS